MDNKKRTIMVPVMTLAVCAIAMVGLGFALTTSVTSELNNIEKLMMDINSDNAFDDVNERPDGDPVNGLFSINIKTDKVNSDTTYKLESNYSYVKVFSNINGTKATLNVQTTSTSIGNDAGQISQFIITLYTIGNSDVKTIAATATIKDGAITPFKVDESTNYELSCDTAYALKITSVTDNTSGTKVTVNETGVETAPNITGGTMNLTFSAVKTA